MENVISNGAPVISAPDSVHPYNFSAKDTITAFVALLAGFLFWEWGVPAPWAPTLGVFIFLALIIVTTLIYLPTKEVFKNKASLKMLAVTVFASFYFLIFDNTPLHFFMFVFTLLSYVMWVVTVSETSIMKVLNGFILGDFLNQVFVVPFLNFSGFFRSMFANDKGEKKILLSLLIGIIVAAPVIIFVLLLLAHADTGFRYLVDNVYLNFFNFSSVDVIWNFLLSIPTACYFFGFIYGNRHKRKTNILKYDNLNRKFIGAHVLPGPAVYGPLSVLNAIYLVFISVLSGYLFSAFQGMLPSSMTYSEYARQGFFELCAVAAINIALIVFSYTFVKRNESEYPKGLRILSGVMSLFTILLVSVAMSKMLMYISSYGLTRLRIYTFWFMILILFVFVLLLIWHFKPFNLGKPVIIGCSILFLMLSFANTDGLIAKYNIDAFEKGRLSELDTQMFYDLSDAAYPYVSSYAKTAGSPDMKREMAKVADYYRVGYVNDYNSTYPESIRDDSVFRLNLQSLLTKRY